MVGHGPLKGFKVPPRSTDGIAGTARSLRTLFAITGTQFDAEKTLESLSKYGITLDVLDDDDPELPRGVEACWVPDTATLIVRQSVYEAACARDPRALFTVAHELGHLTLGHRRTFNRDATGCQVYEDSEWQANTFAAEFLMPLHLIREHGVQTVEHMTALFGVSVQAAQTRLDKLRKKGVI